MKLLTQNAKMQKSSTNEFTVVNWTIPAFQSKTGLRTCPNAGLCAIGCYARQGAYRFGNVASVHEKKLELTQSDNFVQEMLIEINKWLKKRSVKHLKVRIHDAGDFYNVDYLNKWINIMTYFENNSKVSFYAYTKQVKMFQDESSRLPKNFRVIFSYGGKQDELIQIETDFHSRVFETIDELLANGYVDASQDDMIAAIGNCNKIGLVYHGGKNYANTKWKDVA